MTQAGEPTPHYWKDQARFAVENLEKMLLESIKREAALKEQLSQCVRQKAWILLHVGTSKAEMGFEDFDDAVSARAPGQRIIEGEFVFSDVQE